MKGMSKLLESKLPVYYKLSYACNFLFVANMQLAVLIWNIPSFWLWSVPYSLECRVI